MSHTLAHWGAIAHEHLNPKQLQSMIGHAVVQLTYDLFGHLMPDAFDGFGAALDSCPRRARWGWPQPGARVAIYSVIVDVDSFGTIASAIAAVLAIFAAARVLWRNTLGRRWHYARALRRLGTNAHVSFFETVVGGPPAVLATLPFRQQEGQQVTNFERRIWVDKWFLVCTISDRDGTVRGFSVTTRSHRFAPRFVLPSWDGHQRRWLALFSRRLPSMLAQQLARWQYPRFRLGRTTFAAVSATPGSTRCWQGAHESRYEEVHYYGNPGFYLHHLYAMVNVGPSQPDSARLLKDEIDRSRELGLSEDEWGDPLGLADSIGESPELRRFRSKTRVNAVAWFDWNLLEPETDRPDPKTDNLLVHHQEIRTFG